MKTEYIHDKLNLPVESIAGYYMPMKEMRLAYNGREVLCILGSAAIESSYYRIGSCAYAVVPGYIVKWQFKCNENGLPISEIEPIRNEDDKSAISDAINRIDPVTIIDFW